MKRLLLIRHGNKNKTGGHNPSLSTEGRSQAASIELKTDCVVVSPLRRALQTYSESRIHTRRLVVSDLFREKCLSASTFFELESSQPEDAQEFLERVREAISFLRSLPENNITVISHEDFLYTLQEQLGVIPKMLKTAEQIKIEII